MTRQLKNTLSFMFGLLLFTSLGLLLLAQPARAAQEAQVAQDTHLVLVLTADGPVTSAMSQYLARGIRTAELDGAELVVLQLNTPGGSISLMTDMTGAIRASRVPVIVYVSPSGGMAGSAGAIITMAGHASAMAPETIIGAASPVGSQGEDLGQTMAAKEKNALEAEIVTFTEHRPPAAVELAKSMVESAKAVSATEALKVGLVDFIATDLNDLLRQINGFKVFVQGQEVTLQTSPADVQNLPVSFIETLLQILTDPNIVFTLLSVGVMAILIELSSPGGWVAGFVGVVCLALSAYGLGILPVNWFGLVFLAAAFVLFVLDIKAPTHGALTAAGVGSLIVAALVLFNSPGTPSFTHVSVPFVILLSIILASVFAIILTIGLRAQKIPVRTGAEGLVGRTGTVRISVDPKGSVQVASELWSAEAVEGEGPFLKGARVKIVKVDGIHLLVRKADE